jgi:dihydrofolate reductase
MIISILAVADNMAIGFDQHLPWPKIKEDMTWFVQHTKNQVVVMGRNTWDGFKQPLPNRVNLVVSEKNISDFPGAHGTLRGDLQNALKEIDENYEEDIYIIGGKSIYEQCIPLSDVVYLTRIRGVFNADTFFDVDLYLKGFRMVEQQSLPETDTHPWLDFQTYKK